MSHARAKGAQCISVIHGTKRAITLLSIHNYNPFSQTTDRFMKQVDLGPLTCREFTSLPNKPWFIRVCSTSLLKTLWEKEKLRITINFSFSHSVFCPFEKLSAIFINFEIVVC